MATSIIPNEGKVRLLDMLFGGVGFANVRIKLIKADFTLSATMVHADLSFADFTGYAAATPVYGTATFERRRGMATDSERTFTRSAGATSNSIYGYAVVDTGVTPNKLLKVQKEVSAGAMSTTGDLYKVQDIWLSDSDAGVVPNEGKTRRLDMLFGGVGFSDVRIKLISREFQMSAALVYGDLRFADFSGYADVTPAYGSAAISSGKGRSVDSQRTFTHDGGGVGNNIYGYAVVDTAASKLLKVRRGDTPGPVSMAVYGDFYKVTDEWLLSSLA